MGLDTPRLSRSLLREQHERGMATLSPAMGEDRCLTLRACEERSVTGAVRVRVTSSPAMGEGCRVTDRTAPQLCLESADGHTRECDEDVMSVDLGGGTQRRFFLTPLDGPWASTSLCMTTNLAAKLDEVVLVLKRPVEY